MTVTSVIIHDIRSIHNVGSILRSCDGFGVQTVYIGGVSPYPRLETDDRLPHIIEKLTKEISKTALGAEKTVNIVHYDDLAELITTIKESGTKVLALEQSPAAINLVDFDFKYQNVSLLLGREVEGVDEQYLNLCDHVLEIPMHGSKESFNVSVAAGIALYALSTKG